MSRIPTYSLLEKHEDVVSYRVPDPTGETPAWIRIGLYGWELEGVHAGKQVIDELTQEEIDTQIDQAEGIGIRFGFHPPSRLHPEPVGYENRIEDQFNVFSRGYSDGERTFRLQEASPDSLRQTARWVSLYAFAYWWWVEHHTSYPIGKRGTRSEMIRPSPKNVLESGVIIEENASRKSPYTIDDFELLAPSEWRTPYEKSHEELTEVVDRLKSQYTEDAIVESLRDITDNVIQPVEKTKAKEERDRMNKALRIGDGIGREVRRNICDEFESIDELCTDLRNGGDRIKSLRQIGDEREQKVIDCLITSGEWIPVDPETSDEE